MIVETLGLILAVVVHAGKVQDRDGARLVLERLGKGYEQLPENSEAMILIAMINLMSRRLAHGYAKQNF